MLLPAPAESYGEGASAIGIAGMNHSRAASAEAHGTSLTAFCCFNIGVECAVGQGEMVAVDACGKLEGRGAHRLAIAAMAYDDKLSVNGGLPRHVATQAGTIDLH